MQSMRHLVSRSALSVVRRALTSDAATRPTRTGTDMLFTFACPGAVFYHDADVSQVDVPSFSGAFGILPNHVPVLAVLKPGVVAVKEKDGNVEKFFVSSGSVSVNDDSTVQIMAEEACRLEDLDAEACRHELSEAQKESASASDELNKVEAQIRVDTAEALIKAVDSGV